MKRSLSLLAATAWIACATASAAPPATPSAAPQNASKPIATNAAGAQQFTLKNGMGLIVQPDRRAPTAVHMVWVRVGSIDEVDGRSGLAHVLEHMMFKGTPTVPPGDFSRKVAALGGQDNAFTNRDYTGYYQQIPANRLEQVMRLESDRFAHNKWPDSEFKKEIEVIKEERRMRTEDNPRASLMEQLNAATFVASPYHRPVVGWMGDLDSMTPDDARSFHQQWYVPANAVVVVAGDVDVNRVRALAEKYYGSIPARAVPVRKPRPEPEQKGVRRVDYKAPAEQAYVLMAFKVPDLESLDAPKPADQDALALLMLSGVLSGYDGARLDRRLTQGDKRVADATFSGANVVNRGPATFVLGGIPSNGHSAKEVEDALRAEVARVAQEGVSDAELARVKTQWTASTVYERDSVFGQANDLGSNWVLGLPLDANDKLLALLKTVTPAQVQAAAARYFGDDQLTVATLVPQPLSDADRAAQRRAGEAGKNGAVH
ncbi:MAG: M16 family metallopeptidase [Comamonas sp.]